MKNLKKLLLCGLLVIVACAFVACGNNAGTTDGDTNTDANVDENKAVATDMAGADLQAIEDDKEKKEEYLVIDVRSAEEYAAGHVKFAINIFVDDLEANLDTIAAWKDKNVVVYCNSGNKSGTAAGILLDNGFTKVYDADGVKEFEYNLVTWGNVDYAGLQEMVANGAVVVDMRDAKDYEAGHFEGAVNGNTEDLDAMNANLPADKDTLIVTHCYSGNRSAVGAQHLIDLGYTNVWNCMDGAKEVEYDFGN